MHVCVCVRVCVPGHRDCLQLIGWERRRTYYHNPLRERVRGESYTYTYKAHAHTYTQAYTYTHTYTYHTYTYTTLCVFSNLTRILSRDKTARLVYIRGGREKEKE